MDLSVSQDVFKSIGGKRQRFQFRVDIINFGNLLNKNWGVSQRLISNHPLTRRRRPTRRAALSYRLRVINNELMTDVSEQTADFNDVYKRDVQLPLLLQLSRLRQQSSGQRAKGSRGRVESDPPFFV